MKIIDNFLPQAEFEILQKKMMGWDFPWYYNDQISYDEEGQKDNLYQFVHPFFNTTDGRSSDTIYLLAPLLDIIRPRYLLRLKANQNPKNDGQQLGLYHIDVQVSEAITSIFYINTNDGYTKFEDGTIVESVENRLVTFESNKKHVGFGCKETKRRVVLNMVYVPKSSMRDQLLY